MAAAEVTAAPAATSGPPDDLDRDHDDRNAQQELDRDEHLQVERQVTLGPRSTA
jgi:hypothetical protein